MFCQTRYAELVRQAAREGAVLVKNDRQALPLKAGCTVASFGRSQLNYYKSGTGSGGLVHAPYTVSVLDAMLASREITVHEELLNTYMEWVREHPFDEGKGWATEPWCQEEMPLPEELVARVAKEADVAVITIGRLAGEDRDNSAQPGSYLLLPEEERMLELVCRHFEKTVVLLNVGAVIDMKWVRQYDPAAVLYIWQGGQEGGNGVLDLLLGAFSPSGKLTDTVAWDISDYPSTENFGDPDRNFYREDIYVGYRYFETFAKDRVLYPFGFGLSYTTFAQTVRGFAWDGEQVRLEVTVTNTGACPGKEVVQLYVSAPQGALGKPARALCAFQKTDLLAPGQQQTLLLTCNSRDFASFDDTGATGYPFAWVLEPGAYTFYVGGDVRSAREAGAFELSRCICVEQLSEAMSPVLPFTRMRPVPQEEGFRVDYEPVPLRGYDLWARIDENRPRDLPITGDRGYRLADVRRGKVTMEEFVAQIPTEQLCILMRGEGMSSPKVTPGTGGAFGGLSQPLQQLGIPVACCTDGPSGIRMDTGTQAVSLPNGTCLASGFNTPLLEELFHMVGMELRKNRVDVLLGPGLNLHRNPLNGRNFEYFSEDPLLGGRMAAAQLRGLHRHNVTGTIKHFACNSQEHRRHFVDAVVSQRALRELYLKGFEIAVKEAGAWCVMSAYCPVNGLFTASNYDLLTRILRQEWGFRGIVMSDWWAKGNEEGEIGEGWEVAAMVRSQNDLNMVTEDPVANSRRDNLDASAGTHKLTLGDLQRSAGNILEVLMNSPAMDRLLVEEDPAYARLYSLRTQQETDTQRVRWDLTQGCNIPTDLIRLKQGGRTVLELVGANGPLVLELTLHAHNQPELAQIPLYVYVGEKLLSSICLRGKDTEKTLYRIPLGTPEQAQTELTFRLQQEGLRLDKLEVKTVKTEE